MKYRDSVLKSGTDASRWPRNAQFWYGESLIIERYSAHDSMRTTSYRRWPFLFREAISVDVVIQCSGSGFAAEAALFNTRKFNVQIAEDAVIVPKHSARFEPVGEFFRTLAVRRPDRC